MCWLVRIGSAPSLSGGVAKVHIRVGDSGAGSSASSSPSESKPRSCASSICDGPAGASSEVVGSNAPYAYYAFEDCLGRSTTAIHL